MGALRRRTAVPLLVCAFHGLFLLAPADAAVASTSLYTLTPCRVYDSRWGGGPLAGGFDRWIPVGGYCGSTASNAA